MPVQSKEKTSPRLDRDDGGGKGILTMAPKPPSPPERPSTTRTGSGGCLMWLLILGAIIALGYWFWFR